MTHSENEPTSSAAGSQSTDAIWYYEKIGKQPVGPVSEESIKLLLEAKTIDYNTRVWTKAFGKEWKTIKNTDLGCRGDVPPPLPTEEINNIAAWLIAVTPLLVIVISMIFRVTILVLNRYIVYSIWGIIYS